MDCICYNVARVLQGMRSWVLDMGDSYEQKSNLRIADVIGILGFIAVGLLSLYVLGMWIYHLLVSR